LSPAFIGRESGRPLDEDALPDQISVSVITVGELRTGILAAEDLNTRDHRLATLARVLMMEPVPVDGRVADAWALLRIRPRDGSQQMPVNDSWIAATAMALGVHALTQDGDYVDVDGLQVIRV
jgi:predicted nucleic acid-binding protein